MTAPAAVAASTTGVADGGVSVSGALASAGAATDTAGVVLAGVAAFWAQCGQTYLWTKCWLTKRDAGR